MSNYDHLYRTLSDCWEASKHNAHLAIKWFQETRVYRRASPDLILSVVENFEDSLPA